MASSRRATAFHKGRQDRRTSSLSAYTMAEQRYQSGVSSYLEVLDAQRTLFGAQLSLVQMQRQYLVATVDLYRALGGGWNIAAH
jgi:multidrug efflux system outer membrane protein